MATRKEVKSRISSVKNVQKITRAMEMVAAARLRRAEERIDHLRPYAQALRKMTRQVAEAAGAEARGLPVLQEHDQERTVGILLVTGDRGLAGSFNSQIIRAGVELQRELKAEGKETAFSVVGRRGVSTMRFRGEDLHGDYVGFTDRPAFANAREIADQLIANYVDEELDRVDLIYNRYVSPLTQYVRRQTLLPVQQAEVFGEGVERLMAEAGEEELDEELAEAHRRALWVYEPEPEELLAELIPEYAQLNVYRALLESTASEHGARMTAMRNAAENAKEVISDLTLEMNRVRQAEITQEILEVVAGAEGIS
jgi:F-type H+-transporting ATPase subunit gamma